MASVKDVVLRLIAEQPGLSNEQVAALVRKELPGASTSSASVSSIKSNARKSGELEAAIMPVLAEGLRDEEELPEEDELSEEEIDQRIRKRFAALDRMADAVMKGRVPALIVSGPPGLGKSFGIKRAIKKRKEDYQEEWLLAPKTLGGSGKCPKCGGETEPDGHMAYCPECDTMVRATAADLGSEFPCDYISGSISGPGLYISLWNMKDGGLVVLDDCDAVFGDEDTLNILKAVLDSGEARVISWRKQSRWLVDLNIDPQFEFKGSVIFLTNIDFERKVESGKEGAVHFKALMDRCLYLHLTIRTMKDFMVRIKQVVIGENMLDKYGITEEGKQELMDYLWDNRRRFYGLSLRLVHQIALCKMADEDNWKSDIEMTKMRAYSEDQSDTARAAALVKGVGA